MEVLEEFLGIAPEDLWVYNKLQFSKLLGHVCGPIGAPVPYPGWFMIRPRINFLGMGRNARKIWLTPNDDTEKYGYPSEFWCEYITGDHISVDYEKKEQVLTVRGIRRRNTSSVEHSSWVKWEKTSAFLPFPHILGDLSEKYATINVEFIGKKPIEAHFRGNPDFVWGNSVAIPVMKNENMDPPDGYRFVESQDYCRIGFFIK